MLLQIRVHIIMRSFMTHTSINSLQDPIYQSSASFFKQISKKLEQASQWLSFGEFNAIFKKTIRKCIKKAEVDTSFVDAIENIKRWMEIYSYDLEILGRILMLESVVISKQLPHEALEKLKKVKHMLVESDIDYLLVKVFVIESRIYDVMGDKEMKLKVLKKCVEYGENYSLLYLKQSQEIRLEIADNMIIAYFEIFKLTKQSKPNSAIEHLSKAYQVAIKNYGSQHFSSISLAQVLNQQKNIIINMEKILPKALSEIQVITIKKNNQLSILYSWEQELLVVQLDRVKGDERKLLAEATLPIKLNMQKLKLLKSNAYQQWLQLSGGQLKIYEQNVRKIVQDEPQKTPGPPALRQVERGDLFKRNNTPDAQSSSSDDEEIILPEQEKFLKYYRDRSHMSRSKSRDNHTSRH